jgi:hypothetical protein
MEHLPLHQPVPPIFRVIDGQYVTEEVMNKRAKLLSRCARRAALLFAASDATPMCMQDGLNVELQLVAEMVIHSRHVRTGPVADRPDSGSVEPLFGEFLASCFQETNLGSVLRIRHLDCSKHLFQTGVLTTLGISTGSSSFSLSARRKVLSNHGKPGIVRWPRPLGMAS